MDATLDAKLDFERKLSNFGVTVSGYHADSGRFADAAWKDFGQALNQKIQFCGVDSHHQNGIAERRIRDLSDATQASLLHAIHHWPEDVAKNLWPFALKHARNIHNSIQSFAGQTPEEILSGSPSLFTSDLSQYHPFGCLAYVLDARLQGGSKIPRWEPRSRVGVYLGHSPHHANNVALILNLTTGHVSPQYHVVYDDHFSTMDCIRIGKPPSTWPELCSTSRGLVTDENFQLSPEWTVHDPPPSSINWLESLLDSEPSTAQAVFHDATPQSGGDSSSTAPVSSNEGAHEGDATVSQPEGDCESEHDGVVMVDPFSGHPQVSSEHLEPVVRLSKRIRKPTCR